MLLYYITDRHAFPGNEAEKRKRLLDKIAEAARCGVDFIQLREKDLAPRDLEALAREAMHAVRDNVSADRGRSRLLINSRTDIALDVGADGVHLTSSDIAASDARAIAGEFFTTRTPPAHQRFFVAVSCHSVEDVRLAEAHGADFVVFAPVFEKSVVSSTAAPQQTRQLISRRTHDEGLAALKAACHSLAFPDNGEGTMPILALGGITLENAAECLAAGAAGIAGIRLFQDNDLSQILQKLR